MQRRSFMSTMLAAAILDPERLLWVRGKKLVSIPTKVVRSGSHVLSLKIGDLVTVRYTTLGMGEQAYTMRVSRADYATVTGITHIEAREVVLDTPQSVIIHPGIRGIRSIETRFDSNVGWGNGECQITPLR